MPEACRSFSLARMVWKAAGRAPIAPMRARCAGRRPRGRRRRSTRGRAANSGLSMATVWVAVSVNGMPYCRRLLHTEILPQNESRRCRGVELVELVVAGLHQHRHAELGAVQGVDDAQLVAEVGQRDDHAVDLGAVLVEEVGALAGVRARSRPRRSASRRRAG